MRRVPAGAIIPAAGSSQRMRGIDKLFAPIAGRPLLAWTVDAFQDCSAIQQIVLVVHEASLPRARDLVSGQKWPKAITVCAGGARRQDSVARGLADLLPCEWVVIHDGARPCVTPQLIEQGLAAATKTGSAIACVPVTDTVKLVNDRVIVKTLPRSNLWAAQTPQVFRADLIRAAYASAQEDVTDDASLLESMGYAVTVFQGDYDNIKVTSPHDLVIAERILERRQHGA